MIGFLVILLIAGVMIFLTLPAMLRRRELRDAAVYSLLTLGGIVFSTFAALLLPFPSPLRLVVAAYKPFADWLFSAMGWKG
ncbi:hypothetical protein [Cohnella thailandensis]|jgi:hypothetical protein|uniref:Uncharacterized protein n=1 Tax=Cohnella thailandensis TaxID=557557 RepID=A0A841T632_9BACL|nr:hypothetical protein [Cohnella thailandensis]MBB6637327.1 hypothetical protein [Cohnella thailandensis]MBP1976655.1 glucan phosphoethanolaminetransferase (alkaline phosphatase superfamily) [Cohnella thailandensis]